MYHYDYTTVSPISSSAGYGFGTPARPAASSAPAAGRSATAASPRAAKAHLRGAR